MKNHEQVEAYIADRCAQIAGEFDMEITLIPHETKPGFHLAFAGPEACRPIVVARLEALADEATIYSLT